MYLTYFIKTLGILIIFYLFFEFITIIIKSLYQSIIYY